MEEDIELPETAIPKNDYDSHLPLLWYAISQLNEGDIVDEFGCGEGSTPFLLNFCREKNLCFYSYETNSEWQGKYPETKLIENYNKIKVFCPPKQLLTFIDSSPGEQRKEIIENFAQSSKIIIVHDTEDGAEYVYHMAESLSKFKYRIDYTEPNSGIRTTAVSNFIDLSGWRGTKLNGIELK